MAKRIDGYEVPVYDFASAEERDQFLEKWIEENYEPNKMRTDKGQYMGHDAIYVYVNYDCVLCATIQPTL